MLGDGDGGIKGIGQDIGRELDMWSTILRWRSCGAKSSSLSLWECGHVGVYRRAQRPR